MAPKTITGAELDLDDGPARGAELFLVDGNNLAYRAFFALPEELATSDGLPTNALLGFGNMLFKLLADYQPHGVAVAWDTRPTHRAAIAESVEQRSDFLIEIVQIYGPGPFVVNYLNPNDDPTKKTGATR